MKNKSLIVAGFVMCGIAAGAGSVQAGEFTDAAMKNVSYGDLNLSSQAGAKALYTRLSKAASEVCSPFEGRDPARMTQYSNCYNNALTSAVAKVNQTSVSALLRRDAGHARKS